MPTNGCEVCGGRVKPVSDQSIFGYCENCGLVYALRDRLKVEPVTEAFAGLTAGVAGEPVETGIAEAPVPDSPASARSAGSRWRCPDCDMEISSDNDSDLGFAKREHIREYHPNRQTG